MMFTFQNIWNISFLQHLHYVSFMGFKYIFENIYKTYHKEVFKTPEGLKRY